MTYRIQGQLLAILSAALFGVSPVLCKLVMGNMSPILLAGLLYLGSGVGLELLLLAQGKNPLREISSISTGNRFKLSGAFISGGIIAPLCLAFGIRYGTASEVTLLLNLETAATVVISWLIFREHIGPRLLSGITLILLAAAAIVIRSGEIISLSLPGVLIIFACIFWGVDNNLTREVEDLSAMNLAGLKGLVAGIFNVLLAASLSNLAPSPIQLWGSLGIGALSYGLSLVFFVEALRRIGSARTAGFFAVGPFIGTLFSMIILGERPTAAFWPATFLMISGVTLIYLEKHGHIHTHQPLLHRHGHFHDEHHRHIHLDNGADTYHEHSHNHEELTHIHGHWPDIHHRHGHRKETNK